MLSVGRAKRVIVRCCSTQNTLLHVPPEHRRFRRVHGLQLPLHPQQVIGWVLLIVVFTGTFVVLLTTPSLLPADLRFALTPLFATLFVLHALTHLTVLLLDPADPEVRAQPANQVVPEFDRALHRHVIENGRCHLCNITTRGQRTKHCSVCNKCVPRFDHHCKWLNHCIGGRNYPAFLACLVSTLVTTLAVAALALSQLVLVNANLVVNDKHSESDNNNNNNDTSMNNITASSPLWPAPGTGSLVLVTVVGILSAIAAVLLIHLCFFHGYIACLGLTTYEYVRNKREKSIATDVAADTTISSGDGTPGLFCRNNPLFGDDMGTMTRVTTATTDVYVHSTHEETHVDKDTAKNGEDIFPKMLPSTRVSRNFRLCFSYDSRTTETSIEVSSLPSRTTDVSELKNHVESPDAKSSSTPSPVSCCFSIINYSDSRNRKRSEATKRSCGTMRRIQTFLQARLRKGSRQRSSTTGISSSAVARHYSNRIIPQADGSPDVADSALTERENQMVETLTLPLNLDPRLPARLPALDLPRAVCQIGKVPPGPGDISILGLTPSAAMSKRNQTHPRARRSTSFSKKRPRFKIGSHIVTQTVAQLSPIPESEFSKPATPRSPSRSGPAFVFPPLRE